jgi:hypothetical protein
VCVPKVSWRVDRVSQYCDACKIKIIMEKSLCRADGCDISHKWQMWKKKKLEIWGSHRSVIESSGLLGCDTVLLGACS